MCCSSVDIINCVFGIIAAIGSVGACIVAGVSIHLGFKNQSRNKILDVVQHFYLRLKNNLELMQYYFNERQKAECILTYFCTDESIASTHKLVDRLGFEQLRKQIIKLLLENDFNLYERQMNECGINYNIDALNSEINVVLKKLVLWNGIVPFQNMKDDDYFYVRPIYFTGNEQVQSADIAYQAAQEFNAEIIQIINKINALSKFL